MPSTSPPRASQRAAPDQGHSRAGHVLHVLADILVAALTAFLAGQTGTDVGSFHPRVPGEVAQVLWVVTLVVCCLALALRYLFPTQVVAVLGVAMTAHALVFQQISIFLVVPVMLVAAETVQSRLLAPWRWVATAWLFGGVAAMAWYTNLLASSASGPLAPSPQLRAAAVLQCFTALAVVSLWGARRRASRERVEQALERAAMLEAQQEIQARLAVAEDRQRIAREVHDLLGHSLSVIAVQAAGAQAVLTSDPRTASQALDVIGTTSRHSVDEVHALIDTLREEDAHGHTRAEGEAPLAAEAQERTAAQTTDRVPGRDVWAPGPGSSTLEDLPRLAAQYRTSSSSVRVVVDLEAAVPDALSSVLYRTAREALANAARHAPGAAVRVRAVATAGQAQLTVANDPVDHVAAGEEGSLVPTRSPAARDGSGRTSSSSRGLGLKAVRERVEALGGSCQTGPGDHGGWRVHVVIPLATTPDTVAPAAPPGSAPPDAVAPASRSVPAAAAATAPAATLASVLPAAARPTSLTP